LFTITEEILSHIQVMFTHKFLWFVSSTSSIPIWSYTLFYY